MPLPLIAALAPHAGAAVPQLGGTNVEGPQRVVSSRSRFAKPENPFLDSKVIAHTAPRCRPQLWPRHQRRCWLPYRRRFKPTPKGGSDGQVLRSVGSTALSTLFDPEDLREQIGD